MLGSAVIVFRETLEAALIIGVIAAATRGVALRGLWLTAGVVVGILGAALVAALTGRISELAEGAGQELFHSSVLGLAVAMLAWHNIWMSRHGAVLARDARNLGQSVQTGARAVSALFVVVALAVLREGSETALFLYGMLAGGGGSIASVGLGGTAGLAAGALVGAALYAGFVRIPARWFFAVTGWLILLLAASMASRMAGFLVQADLLPSLGSPLWDSSSWLADDSPLGSILHALIGYDARPAGMQVIFYLAVLIAILLGMRRAVGTPRRISPTLSGNASP